MTVKSPRADSYANALTGLATALDKSFYTFFKARPELGASELSRMYEQDAMTARIVDRVVDDATREGLFLTGSDKEFDFGSIESQLEDLDMVNTVGDSWRWARLFGGALIIMIINDGGTLEDPLDLKRARRLSSLQVIESPWVVPSDFNPGLGARAFRNPEFYNITVPFGAGGTRKIHRSRTIRVDGLRVPPTRMIEKNGWGPSVIDRIWTEITQLGEAIGYAHTILHDVSVQIFMLEGLREQLCGTKEDQQNVRRILETLRFNLDNMHMLALDTKDGFKEATRTVTGISELLEKFIDALVRSTDMPRTILLGEQPSGLNASADSEIRAWFDFVASQQTKVLTPIMNSILEVLFAIRRNRNEDAPTEWVVNYKPLWQPTMKEQAETYKTLAEADQIYVLNSIVESTEARQRLINQGLLTEIEEPEEGEPEEEPIETEAETAEKETETVLQGEIPEDVDGQTGQGSTTGT